MIVVIRPMSLTIPVPGDATLVPLRTRYLRRTARLLLEPPSGPPWLAHAQASVRDALAGVLTRSAGDFYGALLLPQVGGPIHAGDLGEAIPTLLTELARRRALGPEGVWWPGPVRRLLTPMRGLVNDFGVERAGMVFRDGEVETAPGEVWTIDGAGLRVFHAMREGGWLAEVDNNPLARLEAHPDKEGNALSLGAATVAEWLTALDDARALIRAALPALADEHRSLLATVVPVGGPMERSLSASYQEVIGLVYVSLHPSPLKMAEALVHELQHNKLNLVAHVDPILVDRGEGLHPSPVRPDPRPLWGVLLAVHAFLPVAAMFRALAELGHPLAATDGFRARFQEVRDVNHDGMAVVRAHARPTELGARLLEEMDTLETEQWGWG